jgi:alpha-beta hydrolase superfamily lysophospholipase/SAM-dependent methyltransferase
MPLKTAPVVAPSTTSRITHERAFETSDGVRLFYRYSPPSPPVLPVDEARAVVLLHRGHEHSGRMAHLIDELNLPDWSFFALDARAHGRSEGCQDRHTTMSTFVQDLDEFARHLRAEYGLAERQLAVVAQSIGAVIAAAWVHDYAPDLRCLVLAAPAFRVKLYIPFTRPALALAHAAVGDFFVQSYVRGNALTQDPERAASYGTDPLIRRPISVRVLLGLDGMAQRLVDDAAAIRVPVQVLVSGSDWVVRRRPQREFYDRLGSAEREWREFPGLRHDTLGELDRAAPVACIREFVQRRFASRTSLVESGSEFTRREYEALDRPLPAWHPRAWPFAVQRWFLATLGRLSDGMRLGRATGYDSGASLDYVYRNQPAGITPLGKLFDYFYLNAAGWRGVRVRRRLLAELVGRAMRAVAGAGHAVRVLDVAAGPGRYLLDAVEVAGITPETVLLRDFDPANVAAARDEIARRGMGGFARAEQGDAFGDPASLREVRANVAIVSGLYELFPSNAEVRRSLAGLAAAVEPGGYLIYTGQPWHPQLEMIARTLTSHRGGRPWIMRRRPQEELDQLVAEAGFRKVAQRIDPDGIFTVSLARRVVEPE